MEDSPWLSQSDEIKKVVIKDGVTSIGNIAFWGCSGLTSVTIPNSVTSIGESAFYGCSGLTSVTIPNSVTSIGGSAFSGCSGLTSLTIGNSVKSIVESAFSGCSGLTSLSIPNSVTSIGESAFSGCSGLTSLTIPNSVTSIGGSAFYNCSGLTSVIIPNSVTSIGYGAFYGTKWYDNQPDGVVYAGKVLYAYKGTMPSNTKIDIKDGTKGIGGSAFYGCSGLTSVIIPNSVTSIGTYAFYGCSGLTSVTIGNSVTSIGDGAFCYCSGLTSVTIGNSVTSIGSYAFEGTKWYDNQPDGVVYAGKVLYAYKGTMPSNTKIEIKEGTTQIAYDAFRDCSGLTSVTIPNSVTSIGYSAFSGCSGLTSVTIPNSVTSIGTYAFCGCSGLTSVICMASTPPYIEMPSKGLPQPFPESTAFYVPSRYVAQYRNAYHWDNGPYGRTSIYVQAIPTTYTLTDGETFNNGLQLDECEISYTRTFNNTAWQALYIPFSLKYEDWKDNFEVAYINNLRQLDTDDDGVIDKTIMDVVKIKDGSLIPNTPYLIKAKSVGEKTLSINNATLYETKENSIDCRTTIAEYTFTGTYNAISASTLIANNYYTMGGGALIMTDGNSGLKPYRWYMKIEARSPMYNVSNAAKAITINVVGEEETTGVEELRMINYKSPVYDLNGRKVNENNMKPGIYVKNGKKFVVK